MAWTDSDTVKKHLPGLEAGTTSFSDVPVTFNAAGVARLPHQGVVEGSETVKRLAAGGISGPSGVALPAETWVALPHSRLVPGSLVAAGGWNLATVHQEGRDYALKAEDGKLRRIAGGGIADGATIQVWYQRYEKMVKDTDYTISYATGEITIKPAGALEPETTVWVDYELSGASAADLLVPAAITEAENKILLRLKEGYGSGSTDQGLITGATELTLATVCRGLAARALADGAPVAEGRAKGWLLLAQSFESMAASTLRSFLAAPTMTAGGKAANQSWEWQ